MRYLREFAEEWKRVGDEQFRLRFGRPALVGVGIHGELAADSKGARKRPTVLSLAPVDDTNLVESEVLCQRVWLVMKSDSARGGKGISFGRGRDNDLVIPEYSISYQHGEFRLVEEQFVIVDLSSYNGTSIDGMRLAANMSVPVADKAKVILGRYQFTFLTPQSFVARVTQFTTSQLSPPRDGL